MRKAAEAFHVWHGLLSDLPPIADLARWRAPATPKRLTAGHGGLGNKKRHA